MATFANIAAQFAAAFETAKRDNESEFVRLKGDAPAWMTDVIRTCHSNGYILPDDWRYRFIAACADGIAEILDDDPEQPDLSDQAAERIDGIVPIFHHERADWLCSHSYRPEYVDAAYREGFVADDAGIMDRIGIGIHAEITEIWETLSRELSARADDGEQ